MCFINSETFRERNGKHQVIPQFRFLTVSIG